MTKKTDLFHFRTSLENGARLKELAKEENLSISAYINKKLFSTQEQSLLFYLKKIDAITTQLNAKLGKKKGKTSIRI